MNKNRNPMRYIYKRENGSYQIHKRINKKTEYFYTGYDLEEVKKYRDYLEDNNWDLSLKKLKIDPNNPNKHICKSPSGKFWVRKRIGEISYSYIVDTLDEARKLVKYLESNGWDSCITIKLDPKNNKNIVIPRDEIYEHEFRFPRTIQKVPAESFHHLILPASLMEISDVSIQEEFVWVKELGRKYKVKIREIPRNWERITKISKDRSCGKSVFSWPVQYNTKLTEKDKIDWNIEEDKIIITKNTGKNNCLATTKIPREHRGFQIIIPAAVRDALNIKPGMALHWVKEEDEKIYVKLLREGKPMTSRQECKCRGKFAIRIPHEIVKELDLKKGDEATFVFDGREEWRDFWIEF